MHQSEIVKPLNVVQPRGRQVLARTEKPQQQAKKRYVAFDDDEDEDEEKKDVNAKKDDKYD